MNHGQPMQSVAAPTVEAAGSAVGATPPPAPSLGAWEKASFTVAHAVLSTAVACLSLGGLYALTRWFATIEWLINYKRRARFAGVLRKTLGREPTTVERRRATREFFIRTRWDKVFYLIFDRIPRPRLTQLLSIENRDLLDDALRRGRGVYIALSHHGSHHVMGLLLPLNGYKIAGVRDGKEGGMRRFVQARFDSLYPEFGRPRVLHSDAFPREIYRTLQEGYVLGSAMDVSRVRAAHQKTEEVEIFGEKQAFLSGPLRIALRCQAPVLQAFILPHERLGYKFDIVQMLIDPRRVDDEDAAVAEAMRVYARNVERYVRAAPWLITRI